MKSSSPVEKFKEELIKILRTSAVKSAIRSLAISSGFGVFVVSYIVEELFDQEGIPLINLAFRKVNLQVDRFEGNLIFKKLKNAEQMKDEAEYNRALDSTLRKL